MVPTTATGTIINLAHSGCVTRIIALSGPCLIIALSGGGDAPSVELMDYALYRDANIRANNQILAGLGLPVTPLITSLRDSLSALLKAPFAHVCAYMHLFTCSCETTCR